MALPQQVLERLSREPPKTPGWSFGLLMFSGVVLFIALLVYFGLLFGYEPYVQSQISKLETQINTLAKSVSPDDQARLVTFYSEITNIQNVLAHHVTFSAFLSWLENNTEANVYYSQFSFSSGSRVTLSGSAASEADVNQQVAIFESAPEVQSVNLSTVSLSPQSKRWQFGVTLVMKSFLAPTP